MKKNKKIKLLLITILLIGVLTTISLFVSKKITSHSKTTTQETLYDSLSSTRQDNYDKMQVQYINIKNRITGTAPFNTESASNEKGVDISPNDNYVRTLDVMKYTVELGIIPNTKHTGVTENSSFKGGVIKVRAKLPNQGSPILMTWEKDAWMENATLSNDNTELYAEYHVPDNVILSNANQNLTFTVKVGGYKRTVTDAMAPEFEIWMEGNKPDDPSSQAPSATKKDNHKTFISGQYSFDFEVRTSGLNNYEKRNGVDGHYVSYGVYAALWQPYDYISDFRGLLYPTEKITVSLEGTMKFHYPDENVGWETITSSSQGATNLINGTTLLVAKTNCTRDSAYYPEEVYRNTSYPGGSRACSNATYAVFDGGTTNGSLSNNNLTITFQNYKFDGTYPEKTLESGTIAENKRRGVFAVANMEFYVPYYNPRKKESLENQLSWTIKSAKVGTNTFSIGGTTYSDGLNNNTANASIVKRSGGLYSPLRPKPKNNLNVHLSTTFYSEDASVLLDDYFIIEAWTRASSGPYEGGFDNLITFNTSMFELAEYTARAVTDPEKMYDVVISSDFGFPTHSIDKTSVKYGIYKKNKSKGLTTDELANNALYNDFDWYTTYSAASKNGKVTAMYCNDTGNTGNGVRTYFRFNIHAIKNSTNIGKTGILRLKTRFYDDKARTKISYFRNEEGYNGSNIFIPTVYDAEGNITSSGAPEEYGETILVIGVKTGIKIASTDLDSSNQMKKSYDVQENEINLKLTPTLENGKAPATTDPKYNNIIVKAILPAGLSYKNGSASKTPKSIIQNPDGTTTVSWVYDNWQINHDPPSDKTITLTANISASLENNTSLNIQATIEHVEDIRDLATFRTANYGVVISNLSGSRAAKSIDKTVLDSEESFVVTSTLGNNNEEPLRNVRSIEILPRSNDDNGSKYSGDYTTKVTSLASGQKMYYTTKSVSELDLPKDKYGKITAKGITLTNTSIWTPVAVNGTIPSSATVVVTEIATIPAKSSINYKMQVIPKNNKKGDTYAFILNMSSDNLAIVVKSNIVVAKVRERRISGVVFEDLDNNKLNDPSDKKLKDVVVELLNSSSVVIATTKTDSGGYYEFSLDGPGSYYVRFKQQTGYNLIAKGTDTNSSKANTNYVTDIINHVAASTQDVSYIKNINMGLVRRDANLKVNYIDINGNNLDVSKNRNEAKHWGDSYTSIEYPFPNYEFVRITGDDANGVISKDNVVVNYVYQLKPAKIIARHYIDGTTTKIHEDVVQDKKYTETYTTSKLDTTDLNYEYVRTDGDKETDVVSKDSYTINYYYKLKQGKVITHHYKYDNGDTTESLAPDVSKTYKYTETYTTDISDKVPKNYEFYKKSNNFTDILKKPEVHVYYYYRLKDSDLTTSISKTGTEEITNKDEEVKYTIKYNASLKEYIGDGTIKIVDSLPYEIDYQKSNLAGGEYNSSQKTITWVEDWKNINTYEEENATANKEIIKEITIVYKGIVGRDRMMVNTIQGHIDLINNKKDAEDQYSTNIRIKGKIIVKHVDEETGEEIAESVSKEDLVGEEFISESKEIDGYMLIEKPLTEHYEIEEEEQVVIYKYRHLKYEVKGIVIGDGGTIRGDEDVFWGNDSTKDYIVIEADDGYVIDRIRINGEEIEIDKGQDKLVLNQFLKMTEDKNIDVKFVKKPENPPTGAFLSIMTIIISLMVGVGIFIISKKLSIFHHIN